MQRQRGNDQAKRLIHCFAPARFEDRHDVLIAPFPGEAQRGIPLGIASIYIRTRGENNFAI